MSISNDFVYELHRIIEDGGVRKTTIFTRTSFDPGSKLTRKNDVGLLHRKE